MKVFGAGLEKRRVDLPDKLRPRNRQQVIVALEITFPVGEAVAAVVVFAQAIALYHRAHGAIEQHDALPEQRKQ